MKIEIGKPLTLGDLKTGDVFSPFQSIEEDYFIVVCHAKAEDLTDVINLTKKETDVFSQEMLIELHQNCRLVIEPLEIT